MYIFGVVRLYLWIENKLDEMESGVHPFNKMCNDKHQLQSCSLSGINDTQVCRSVNNYSRISDTAAMAFLKSLIVPNVNCHVG